jgi:hypothetical protein
MTTVSDGVAFEKFEADVMLKLLDGNDPVLAILRQQYRQSEVVKREFTGVGFFTTFRVYDSAPRLPGNRSLYIGDVVAEIDGVDVGFVLFITDGVLDMLEGYTYGTDEWPREMVRYKIGYISGEQRDIATALEPRSP